MFAKVKKDKLYDAEDRIFVPRGMNWSEPWLIDYRDGTQCVDAGCNTVRIWCKEKDWVSEKTGVGKPGSRIRETVHKAAKAGLYVILVLGEMLEGPSNTLKPWRFQNQENRVIKFWEDMAREFASSPNILAFEIMNEPTERDNAGLYGVFCNRVCKAIRAVDGKRLIAIPALDIASPSGLRDEIIVNLPNIFYTFNFYDPYRVTHTSPPTPWPWGEFTEERMKSQIYHVNWFRNRHQVPVICCELGCLWHAPEDTELRWLFAITSLLNKYKIGWFYWGWKGFRSIGFHINYNEVDRGLPTRFKTWDEAKNLITAKLKEP